MTKPVQPVRIVIADDHPLFRFGLKKFLEAHSELQVVGEATDGQEALQIVANLKPDILLLDLAMPRLPGLETLRELVGGPQPVKTIVLTAAIEKEQIVEALQLGARGVVVKDAATESLLKAIDAVRNGQYWVGRENVDSLVETLRSLAPSSVSDGRPKTYGLTPRELDVVEAIVEGCTNKHIAEKFNISELTVKHHLTHIFDKVGVSNRLELALFAINKGLVGSRK